MPHPRHRVRPCIRRGGSAALAWLLAFGATAVSAKPVVFMGDSWGVLAAPAMATVLDAEGLGSALVHNAAVGGSTAAQWNAGVFDINAILASNPDVEVVHLILGGNDLAAFVPIPDIVTNLLSVLNTLAGATSAAIVFTGYDYLANPPVPPVVANAALDFLLQDVSTGVAADPLLAGRVVVLNTHGLMQVHFGVPQVGLPPFDPSLPDATLPGPTTAFIDVLHLTLQGYAIYTQEIFDNVYGCADGLDNDGDGLTDLLDPGCAGDLDLAETDAAAPCDDGFDNDGDGRSDFDPITAASPGDNSSAPAGSGDPGCMDPTWHTENPKCQNGEDDGASLADYDGGFNGPPGSTFGGTPGLQPDLGCLGTPWKDSEACGFGPELALLLPLLWLQRRRR